MGELVYIDEWRRERWLLKLAIARETGEVAVFGALQPEDAQIIEFPAQDDPEGDPAA